jgi:hypothetical protein
MADDTIKISLTRTNFLTRWHCHTCGGWTEKDPVLAEGKQDLPNNEYRIVRVCDQCLKGAEGLSIDQRLENFVRVLEDEVKFTRAMIGRLQVPTHAEWWAANECDEYIPF